MEPARMIDELTTGSFTEKEVIPISGGGPGSHKWRCGGV